MEIKVGEKIRCNDGLIGELIRIERDDIDISLKWYVFDDGKNERYVNKPYITKHSFNIIDLIEIGDIIEAEIDGLYFKAELDKIDIKHKLKNIGNNIKIKSILTHEQFEANCYKVKGE